MFNLSGSEIIIILLLALVILGPEKLPDAIRRFGRLYAELKRMSSSFQDEMRSTLDEPMREMRETADLLRDQANFDVDDEKPRRHKGEQTQGGAATDDGGGEGMDPSGDTAEDDHGEGDDGRAGGATGDDDTEGDDGRAGGATGDDDGVGRVGDDGSHDTDGSRPTDGTDGDGGSDDEGGTTT